MLSPYYSTIILSPQPLPDVLSPPPLPLSAETSAKRLSTAATKVIQAFQRHEDGRLDQSQLEFQLERHEYREVLDFLKQDHLLKSWVDCKLRYNYNPAAKLLEVCMPTRTHELVTAGIIEELENRIHQFSTQCALPSPLPAFLNAIQNELSSDIFAHDDPDHKRSPDAAFAHPDDQFPGIVIETSYSQAVKKVEKRADEYIMMSNGNIMMVIGFDVEYRSNNQQVDTLSVWRSVVGQDEEGPFLDAECIVNREPFRDAKTKIPINTDRNLTIPLSAFAATSTLLAHSIPLAEHATIIVTIPFLTLANRVTAAQEREIRTRNFRGVVRPVVAGERKRRRASTPPEEITSEDEKAWERKEKLSEQKEEQEDGSWEDNNRV